MNARTHSARRQATRRSRAHRRLRRHATPAAPAETLEPRLMMDAGDPTAVWGGVLNVYGTDGPDTIVIEEVTDGYGETWWYRNTANFAWAYGQTHPVEDWATSWEVYFYDNAWMATNMPAKFALLDAFFTTCTG